MNISLNTTQPTTIGAINLCDCEEPSGGTTTTPAGGVTSTPATTPTNPTKETPSATTTEETEEAPSNSFQQAVTKLLETFKEILQAFQQFLSRTNPTTTPQPSGTQPTPISSAPTGTNGTESKDKAPLTKVGEFLWKPQSDKDGKLAVLLPSSMTGKIKTVKVISPTDGRVLATGKYSGVGNGNREHFRFTKAGGSYPDGSIVRVTTNAGAVREVPIKETSARMTW